MSMQGQQAVLHSRQPAAAIHMEGRMGWRRTMHLLALLLVLMLRLVLMLLQQLAAQGAASRCPTGQAGGWSRLLGAARAQGLQQLLALAATQLVLALLVGVSRRESLWWLQQLWRQLPSCVPSQAAVRPLLLLLPHLSHAAPTAAVQNLVQQQQQQQRSQ
jgi:hypothetical protein